jgi:hypothetical protein
MLDVMMTFFEKDGWPFHVMESKTVLQMAYAGDNGRWNCYAQAREEQQQFVFYSMIPVNATEEKRAVMAEFITRVNYGLVMGDFEMDYTDGEIRFKTSIDVEGDELSEELIANMVRRNVYTTDRYLPGVMAVLYADATPEAAVAKIEEG